MNWYKNIFSQNNLWDISRKEHTGEFPSNYDEFTDEQQDEFWKENRRKTHEWEQEVQRAISLGVVSPQEAKEKGYVGYGISDVNKIRKLPNVLYHVTTNKDSVIKDTLKSRIELGQDMGSGLGGGDEETISFTEDKDIAWGIYNAIKEARGVTTSELTISDMIKQSIEGTDADSSWIQDLLSYHKAKNPEELISYFEGDYEFVTSIMPKSVEEMNKDNFYNFEGQYKFFPVEKSRWAHGEEEKYIQFKRKRSPSEKIEKKFEFFKTWASFREHAGGPLNPLFFLNDVSSLASVPEDQIAILEYRAKPNSYGYIVGSLGEWRTWTGDAVELVKVIQ